MGVIDYPPQERERDKDIFKYLKKKHGLTPPVGHQMIKYLVKVLTSNKPLCAHIPIIDMNQILISAMKKFDTPPGFSGTLIEYLNYALCLLHVLVHVD